MAALAVPAESEITTPADWAPVCAVIVMVVPPVGGVSTALMPPWASVVPKAPVSEPELAATMTSRPAIGAPLGSMAATATFHGPALSPEVCGAAKIASPDTETTATGKPAATPPFGEGFRTDTLNAAAAERSDAGIVAVKLVLERYCVESFAPPTVAVDVGTNPVPARVTSAAGEPTAMTPGETEVTAGGGLFTVKFAGCDEPPPGEGLITTTGKTPPAACSDALSATAICCELVYATVAGSPLNVAVELAIKPLPLIVSVWAAAPALDDAGDKLDITGTGLFACGLTAGVCEPPQPASIDRQMEDERT